MITEQQQEQATLHALGLLGAEEQRHFADQVRANAELRDFLHLLQRTFDAVVLSVPAAALPAGLKAKVLGKVGATATAATREIRARPPALPPGFRFISANDP